jgi:hypothetical protein
MMPVFPKGKLDGKAKASIGFGVVEARHVKNLRTFAKETLSGPEAAKKLRRTPGAVRQKAMKLGIRFRSIRRQVR